MPYLLFSTHNFVPLSLLQFLIVSTQPRPYTTRTSFHTGRTPLNRDQNTMVPLSNEEIQRNLQRLEARTYRATPFFNFDDMDKLGVEKDFLHLTQRTGIGRQ
jgi:hypothetical protein